MSVQEPEPEAPEPEPEPQPEPEAEPEPDAPGPGDGDAAKARREARNLREKLKAEQAGRDKAISEATASLTDRISELEGMVAERDAQLAAVGKLRNPKDITHFLDVAGIKPDDLPTAIAALVKERPYLAAAVPVTQGQQGNGRPETNGASDWLRDQIIRKS